MTPPDIVLSDDGTLDTLFTCNDCNEEMRYNYDPESGESYEEFVKWALQDAKDTHECGQHTPGPWEVMDTDQHGRCICARNKGNLLITVGHAVNSNNLPTKANARLIAAAPVLLEALTILVVSLEWEEQRSGTTYAGYENARAAIAQARGED